MNACMNKSMHDSLDNQFGDCVQMYHFRNTGPRIMPPQQSSRGTDGTGDPNGDMLNPDGSIRSGKKRKSHDNVATSYVALPLNAPTGLVASSRCEMLCSAVDTLSHALFTSTTIITCLLSVSAAGPALVHTNDISCRLVCARACVCVCVCVCVCGSLGHHCTSWHWHRFSCPS